MGDLIVETSGPVALVGGAPLGADHLKILQRLTQIFVAADSGADHLHAAGITPRAVIGDLDSLSGQSRTAFLPYLHPIAEQETNDLEKAVRAIAAPVVVGAGFLGGRLDHGFAAFNLLARAADVPLILMGQDDCCFRAPSGLWQIDLPVGTAFAILPMTQTVVTSDGLVWDMTAMHLSPVGRVSASNRTAKGRVRIDCAGAAIVTLPLTQLPAAIDLVRLAPDAVSSSAR